MYMYCSVWNYRNQDIHRFMNVVKIVSLARYSCIGIWTSSLLNGCRFGSIHDPICPPGCGPESSVPPPSSRFTAVAHIPSIHPAHNQTAAEGALTLPPWTCCPMPRVAHVTFRPQPTSSSSSLLLCMMSIFVGFCLCRWRTDWLTDWLGNWLPFCVLPVWGGGLVMKRSNSRGFLTTFPLLGLVYLDLDLSIALRRIVGQD